MGSRRQPLEESPGSTETRCRITSGGGDPRESATENKPPVRYSRRVRVKGCGKSAPRGRQRTRHGKPHREQDQIGMAGRAIRRRQMCFRIVIRVGRVRRSATIVPEEWPYRHLRMLDRTRLIDRLILLADRFSLGLFPAMPGFHTDKKSQK